MIELVPGGGKRRPGLVHPACARFAMILRIRHKGLRRLFAAGEIRGIMPAHAQRLRLILARLHAAAEPKDMNLPGLRLHQLKGELDGYYAVDVSGNWRIVFRFEGADVTDVDYLDYH